MDSPYNQAAKEYAIDNNLTQTTWRSNSKSSVKGQKPLYGHSYKPLFLAEILEQSTTSLYACEPNKD